MSAISIFKSCSLTYNFVIEFATHPTSFYDFYALVEKSRCTETIDFFFIGLFYKGSTSVNRRVMEKQIYEYFIKAKVKREINIPEKMRKEIEQSLGWGYSNVFDGALVHCADSLCTNFWIDFSKKNLVPEKEKQLSGKSLTKLTLLFAMPKYLAIPVLSFFGKEPIKHPRFLLEDARCIKNWIVRSNRSNLVELVCDIFKIDNDIIFIQNMVRVLFDRGSVMSRLIIESISYEQTRVEKKGKWNPKDAYPMEVFMTFIFNCSRSNLNKSLKRIIEQLYLECPTRDSAIDQIKVHKFLNLLLEEIIRPKDTEFRKVRLLLFYIHNHLKKLYGDAVPEESLLKYGVCNMMILYLQRCFDDPFLIGIQPTKGVYARPTIAAVCDIVAIYFSEFGSEKLAYKDKKFQECYNDYILNSSDLLQKLLKYYSDLVTIGEDAMIEDYQEILVSEYKKYGFVSIEDQFLYEITGDEESKINADYPSWYGVKEDVDYFSRLNIIGQHLVNYREKIRLKHSETEGQKALKMFLASNKMESLRSGAKKLKFPDADGFMSLSKALTNLASSKKKALTTIKPNIMGKFSNSSGSKESSGKEKKDESVTPSRKLSGLIAKKTSSVGQDSASKSTVDKEEKKSTKSERTEEKLSESSSAQPLSTNNSNLNSIASQPSNPNSEASNDEKKPEEIEKKKTQESITDK